MPEGDITIEIEGLKFGDMPLSVKIGLPILGIIAVALPIILEYVL